jgi:hypothetical protein
MNPANKFGVRRDQPKARCCKRILKMWIIHNSRRGETKKKEHSVKSNYNKATATDSCYECTLLKQHSAFSSYQKTTQTTQAMQNIHSTVDRFTTALRTREIEPKFFVIGVTGLSVSVKNDVASGQARLDVMELPSRQVHSVTMGLRGEESVIMKLKRHFVAHGIYPVTAGSIEPAKFGKNFKDAVIRWDLRAGVKSGNSDESGAVLLVASDTCEPVGKILLRAGKFVKNEKDERGNVDLLFENMTVKIYEDRVKSVSYEEFKHGEVYVLACLRQGRGGPGSFSVAGFFASYTVEEAVAEFGVTTDDIYEAASKTFSRVRAREEIVSEEF